MAHFLNNAAIAHHVTRNIKSQCFLLSNYANLKFVNEIGSKSGLALSSDYERQVQQDLDKVKTEFSQLCTSQSAHLKILLYLIHETLNYYLHSPTTTSFSRHDRPEEFNLKSVAVSETRLGDFECSWQQIFLQKESKY